MANETNRVDPATDRRKKTRFAISPSFPLKTVIALCNEAGAEDGGAWKDWSGTLVNLSAAGAHIQVNLAAVAFPENPCRVKLSLGTFKLEIPGTVAHFVCRSRYAVCGVHFDFSNEGVEKAYFRVLEPVIMGASLAPFDSTPDASGRHKEEFRGKNSSALTVWRESPGGAVTGFDCRLNRFAVELDRVGGTNAEQRAALNFRLAGDEDTATPVTAAQVEQARWLFRLTVSNLSNSVPADVRKFLLTLV